MPGTRRSALTTLTAEQQAFLAGPTSLPATISPESADCTATVQDHPDRVEHHPPTNGNAARAQSLRSVTLRLHPEIAAQLRRAAIERSLEYDAPYTQQSIVEQALRDWLTQHGYLDQPDQSSAPARS